MYAAEYKGSYPPVQMWHWPNGGWGNPWWDNPDMGGNPAIPDGPGMLYTNGYVKDARIYYCPAQEEISWLDWQDREQFWVRVNQGDMQGLNEANIGYFVYAKLRWHHVPDWFEAYW